MKLFELSGVDREEFIESVQKDCQSYLQNNSPTNLLYRGMKDVGFYDYTIPRRDRRPRDISQKAHEKLDELFEKDFGFKYRSGGVFASPSPHVTSMYSDSRYVIFPAGDDYDMCGSLIIQDIVQAVEMSGSIGSSQLKFSPFYAQSRLSEDEFKEYEQLSQIHLSRSQRVSRTPEQEKRYDKLNEKIFSALGYFESKQVADFKRSEVQIYCKGYYSVFYDEYSKDTKILIEEIYKK